MTQESRNIEYVKRVLRMNPLTQANDIVVHRAAFLQGSGANPIFTDDATSSKLFEAASQRLEQIREQFWALDDADLNRRFDGIPIDDFPQLFVAVERLRSAAGLRQDFDKLKDHPDCFPEFIDALKRIAIAWPGQIEGLKADEIEAARFGDLNNRTPQDYQRAATAIHNECPKLFSFEEDWLTQLMEKRIEAKHLSDSDDGCLLVTAAILVTLITLLAVWRFLY